jgi:hypothetical protein
MKPISVRTRGAWTVAGGISALVALQDNSDSTGVVLNPARLATASSAGWRLLATGVQPIALHDAARKQLLSDFRAVAVSGTLPA